MEENKIKNLYAEEDVLRMLRSFHTSEINVQLSMAKLTPINMEAKQTAVEWLESILHDFIHPEHGAEFFPFIEQAKAMEKEQIMDDFNAGQWAWAEHLNGKEKKDPAEYYNETYGKA